jgi:hypothetical protein
MIISSSQITCLDSEGNISVIKFCILSLSNNTEKALLSFHGKNGSADLP